MDSSGSAEGPLRVLINTRVNVRLPEKNSIVFDNLTVEFSKSIIRAVELF